MGELPSVISEHDREQMQSVKVHLIEYLGLGDDTSIPESCGLAGLVSLRGQ